MSNLTYRDVKFTNLCGATGAAVTDPGGRTVAAYALTPCCEAHGKGNPDSPTGVVCRACYRPVAAAYGANGWEALQQAARDAKCPVPDACADHVMHKVMVELQPDFGA